MSAAILYMQSTINKDKQNNPLDSLAKINEQIEATLKAYHAYTKQHSELLESLSPNNMFASRENPIYKYHAKLIADNEKELKDLTAEMKDVKAKFPTIDKQIDLNVDNSALVKEKIRYQSYSAVRCEVLKREIARHQKENSEVDNLIMKQEAAKPLEDKRREMQTKLTQLRKEALALRRALENTPEAQTEDGKRIMKFH